MDEEDTDKKDMEYFEEALDTIEGIATALERIAEAIELVALDMGFKYGPDARLMSPDKLPFHAAIIALRSRILARHSKETP